MIEQTPWWHIGKLITSLVAQYTPKHILKWRWPAARIMSAVEIFHFNQPPRFYVREERGQHELEIIGFNVFNFSPFPLVIVGAELEAVVGVDSMNWFTYKERLPSEIHAAANARSGFYFKRSLDVRQVSKLRAYHDPYTNIRVRGAIIFRTIYGEFKKDVHADVIALIDRDERTV